MHTMSRNTLLLKYYKIVTMFAIQRVFQAAYDTFLPSTPNKMVVGPYLFVIE